MGTEDIRGRRETVGDFPMLTYAMEYAEWHQARGAIIVDYFYNSETRNWEVDLIHRDEE